MDWYVCGMETELTLAELEELGDYLIAPDCDETSTHARFVSNRDMRALLAMARELIRIRSALYHLDKRCFATANALFADRGQSPDDRESGNENMSAEGLLDWAVELGWSDPSPPATPVAELKGGEG